MVNLREVGIINLLVVFFQNRLRMQFYYVWSCVQIKAWLKLIRTPMILRNKIQLSSDILSRFRKVLFRLPIHYWKEPNWNIVKLALRLAMSLPCIYPRNYESRLWYIWLARKLFTSVLKQILFPLFQGLHIIQRLSSTPMKMLYSTR